MFRTVLVPLDGSWFAESALPVAARLVKDARARLHLVLVNQPVAALVPMGELPLLAGALDEGQLVHQEAYLAATVVDLVKQGLGPAEYRELEGLAGPVLCEEATRVAADLVVMATHGRGGFRRRWLGNVADYAVRHLAVPILLVHPDRMAEPRSSPSLRGILVALDLCKDAEAILEPVIALAQLTQGHVTLLHVLQAFQEAGSRSVPYPVLQDPASFERCHMRAQRALDAVADRLRERGLSVATRVKMGISQAGTLLEALEEQRFDLIAITTHGAGGMRRLLLGGVADKVIRGAAKPVLVLRPLPAVF